MAVDDFVDDDKFRRRLWDIKLEDDDAVEQDDEFGQKAYLAACSSLSIVPVTYLLKRLQQETISIDHHGLGKKGATAVAALLRVNEEIRSFSLADNWIDSEGAEAIAGALLVNERLRELYLGQNHIGHGCQAIFNALSSNRFLTTLDLSHNGIDDSDTLFLARALAANSALSTLTISHNNIGPTGGVALATGLAHNKGLTSLDIGWNHLRGEGGNSILLAIATNDSMTSLDLSWNGLGDDCARTIADVVKTSRIVTLNLACNRMSAVKPLAATLRLNDDVQTLNLSGNPVGDTLHYVIEALKENQMLSRLILKDVRLESKVLSELDEVAELKKGIGRKFAFEVDP